MDMNLLAQELEEVSVEYAGKNGIERDSNWFTLKLHEELGELTQAYLMKTGQARRKGLTDAQIEMTFEAEIADVFAHVLLLAKYHDVDVIEAVEDKWLRWHPSRQP
ncbi:pyrophosphatase [Arthrobacter sp. CDRTa11]|uniref:pyrophosphatase n=1 Tax=Arthrobacter sp. CDRTa11 TaxID=2651199 RepID=UPI0022658077|nr:pyrophosphatase [Arthrobacter sp. CDRTa11]UZX04792.1 pyrophosphatase [Arthrobacter sp. CDRTa11]